MDRTPFLALALLLAVPLGLAHNPPAPTIVCDGWAAYHDYLPPVSGSSLHAADGNTQNCGGGLTFDGDFDHGYGGVILLVETGDGVTYGAEACFGVPSIGHHSSDVYAVEYAQSWGPRFMVAADASHAGFVTTPDCGDGFIEPCSGPGAGELRSYSVEGWTPGPSPVLGGCNAADQAIIFQSANVAPSGGNVPFGPGANGAYAVHLLRDSDYARTPRAGHVWTM